MRFGVTPQYHLEACLSITQQAGRATAQVLLLDFLMLPQGLLEHAGSLNLKSAWGISSLFCNAAKFRESLTCWSCPVLCVRTAMPPTAMSDPPSSPAASQEDFH